MHNISNDLQCKNKEKATAKNQQRVMKNPEFQKTYLEDENPYATVSRMKNRLIQKSAAKKSKTKYELALYSQKSMKKKE